ncbi:aminoacyl tRNA synthase complex-interacting multifunctional protein 1-like isoform X1 [Dunckerocampus dactyliophorus]|uniref:aminoacyl tRNA synthase complex-interacting multifunctional protein 1-like isoform X1 n=1 Tax=Dunckerocampus dactyliophorus TaxID=161453 RepID=UPI0024052A91|nr:aminoacyl tRNA synthase complex-interacting multifunctional protein 1-like isoform X1 [Dunckerocampus dactyliophorus]XP_054656226.1 aminoacyl tRNA synthase complex-interacting multifunctional protein 1-like isoform X1 [Dunckerocampus dactyliophorus]
MDPDKMFHPSLAAALKKLDPEDGEKMMEYFQTHALLTREKALLQASVREQKKLMVENGKLKKDIEQLRLQLQDKQRRRVAKALLSPSHTFSTPVNQPPSSSDATAASPSPSAALEQVGKETRRQRGYRRAPTATPLLEAALPVDVSRLDLRVGRILSVGCHPLAENLTVQEVDVGEKAPRTVVSKLAREDVRFVFLLLLSSSLLHSVLLFFHQLDGALAVLLCNVKACKLKGVASQARLLWCVQSDHTVELLAPPTGSIPGDRVTCLDFPGEPDHELRSKQRVWERIQPSLQVDARGVANYKGCGFQVKGKGLCRAPSFTNCTIR